MKRKCFIPILLLSCTSIAAQPYITDTINPLVENSSNGGDIWKYFSITMYSLQPSQVYNKKQKPSDPPRDPYLMMVALYSNSLAVNNKTVLQKIPELKKFPNDTANHSTTMAYTYPGQYAIPVFDSTGIIILVEGINKKNAGEYEFRVIKNQTEVVVPWRSPTLFYRWIFYDYIQNLNRTPADTAAAYLGQFKSASGNRLTFEVRRKDNPALIQARQSALWLDRFPAIVNVFTTSQMQGFLETFKKQWKQPQMFEEYEDWLPEKDSLQNLPTQFKAGENNLIFYLDDIIRSKEILEYNLVSGNDSTGWKANDFDLNFIWLKNIPPGDHRLKIRFSVQRHNVTTYAFTIQTYWFQAMWFKIAAGIASLLAIFSVWLFIKNRRQQAEIKKQQMQQQVVEAEIKAIKSQFNPHFVFNALNSIQGLITKNDMHAAHQYLSDFSALLRNSLKESEQEFISLSRDIALVNNYLKLEQLRFGFTYHIHTEATLNKEAIEVPVLLLQPVIENAVKHGISGLYEKGQLDIHYTNENNNLVIKVKDNGAGYNANGNMAGYGLKLTGERTALINKTLTAQSIEWTISKEDGGTTVLFKFKNWLL